MSPPRFTCGPLPHYAFVPGKFPHPHADPAGHRFGSDLPPPEPVDPDRWQCCAGYLLGVDLFNHGYYWEAHEAWEAVWNALGRHGPAAAFVKGLIQLAVAGVKIRQGMPDSAAAHAARGAELMREVAATSATRCMGFDLETLARWADQLAERPPLSAADAPPVEVVFKFLLMPS